MTFAAGKSVWASLSKIRPYGLYKPARFARACVWRLFRNLSVEEADSLGLLNKSVLAARDYIFDPARAGIPGAIPPEANRRDEEDKLRFAARAAAAGLPIPETLCVIGRRKDTDPAWQGEVLESGATLAAALHSTGEVDGICKPARGGQGWDILPLQARAGHISTPTPLDTADAYFAHLATRGYEQFCWIVQQRERAHQDLKPLMPGPGLGTVRIHSALRPDGDVRFAWPTLKIPGTDALSDNWHGGRRGGMLAPVDTATGVLGSAVGRAPGEFAVARFAKHPTSGAAIEGFRLPQWDELLELTRRAAQAFPMLPVLGWDIALTDRGPVIIEANWKFGFRLPQTAHGRGLGREIRNFFALAL